MNIGKKFLFFIVSLFPLCLSAQWKGGELLKNPLGNQILVAAHRGDWRRAPENSLQGIKNCIDAGIDMVEIDLRRTKDGYFVLMHDETIDRTTTGKGYVRDLTISEIRSYRLKNGANHKTRHLVPTLDEVLALANGRILLNIDKGYDYFAELYPILQRYGVVDQVVIKSGATREEVEAAYPGLLSKMIFFPVVSLDSSNAVEIIEDYLSGENRIYGFELNFETEPPYLKTLLSRIRGTGAKIFFNSMWPELSAVHDDDIAVEDGNPDGSWGWSVRAGASIIQTDRPVELKEYLQEYAETTNRKIYLDLSGTQSGDGDGSRYAPFTDIGDAFEWLNNGDTILISGSEYKATQKADNILHIEKRCVVIGGYNSDFSERIGRTILDGNRKVSHIVEVAPNCDVEISGFELCGGEVVESSNVGGAGIYNRGNLWCSDVCVRSNKGAGSVLGGGVYNSGSLWMVKCMVMGNTAPGDGGGVYIDGVGVNRFENCRFEDNVAKSGSAIFVKNSATLYICSCSFSGNISETYGTLTIYNKSYKGTTLIVNSTFARNQVANHKLGKTMLGGAGIYLYGDPSAVFTLMNNTIVGNSCDARDATGRVCQDLGGAVVLRSGNLSLLNNMLLGNNSASGYGDLYKIGTSAVTASRNIFGIQDYSNVRFTPTNQWWESYEKMGIDLPKLLDVGINGSQVEPVLKFDARSATSYIPLRGVSVSGMRIDNLAKTALMETSACDLDMDGRLVSYLEKDQLGNQRSLSGGACVGAVEYIGNSGVENITVDSADCKLVYDETRGLLKYIGEHKVLKLSVYDMWGLTKLADAEGSLSVTELPKGVYIGACVFEKGETITTKFEIR